MSTTTTPKWVFNKELADLKGKYITVVTTTGKSFNGLLKAWNPDTFDLCLSNVNEGKNSYFKVFLRGPIISEILISEQPFDLQGLASELQERLNLLEADVKLYADARMIQVLNKVKVTEKGVEGTGPVADRVRVVFEQFMESLAEEEEKDE
ncbi:MAG: Lsm family RNA-binding protein [Candidatus Heimdallarchaeota archaeon]|nr:Lsm family RNA-binding protein [Candidatus Heimdallarchaeota archaeon]